MNINFSCFSNSVLTKPIGRTDTTLYVDVKSIIPPPSGEYYYFTIIPSITDISNVNKNEIEIIKVTAINDDSITVVRGQCGTPARAFKAFASVVQALNTDTLRGFINSVVSESLNISIGGAPLVLASDENDGLLSPTDFDRLTALESFALAPATHSILGGVKIGPSLQINETGTLSILTDANGNLVSSTTVVPVANPSFNNVQNLPTTASGYGITDAVPKTHFHAEYIKKSDVGVIVGGLGIDGKIISSTIPADIKVVIPSPSLNTLIQNVGTPGKLYITTDTNKVYSYSGSAYIEVTPDIVNSVQGKTGDVTLSFADITKPNNFVITDAALVEHNHDSIYTKGPLALRSNLKNLPKASTNAYGFVKIGNGITVDADGNISATDSTPHTSLVSKITPLELTNSPTVLVAGGTGARYLTVPETSSTIVHMNTYEGTDSKTGFWWCMNGNSIVIYNPVNNTYNQYDAPVANPRSLMGIHCAHGLLFIKVADSCFVFDLENPLKAGRIILNGHIVNSVIYANNKYVFVVTKANEPGVSIITSSDCITWDNSFVATNNLVSGKIQYNGSVYVVKGVTSSTISFSTDLVSWNTRTGSNIFNGHTDLITIGGKFYYGYTNTDEGISYVDYSTDGTIWTPLTISDSEIRMCGVLGSDVIVCTTSNTVYAITNNTVVMKRQITGLKNLSILGNTIVATTNNGYELLKSDYTTLSTQSALDMFKPIAESTVGLINAGEGYISQIYGSCVLQTINTASGYLQVQSLDVSTTYNGVSTNTIYKGLSNIIKVGTKFLSVGISNTTLDILEAPTIGKNWDIKKSITMPGMPYAIGGIAQIGTRTFAIFSHGVIYSDDAGSTWSTMWIPQTRIWGFGFTSDTLYVACDNILYISGVANDFSAIKTPITCSTYFLRGWSFNNIAVHMGTICITTSDGIYVSNNMYTWDVVSSYAVNGVAYIKSNVLYTSAGEYTNNLNIYNIDTKYTSARTISNRECYSTATGYLIRPLSGSSQLQHAKITI